MILAIAFGVYISLAALLTDLCLRPSKKRWTGQRWEKVD